MGQLVGGSHGISHEHPGVRSHHLIGIMIPPKDIGIITEIIHIGSKNGNIIPVHYIIFMG